MKLTFIGAAHEVTGSCTLLECCGGYFLIDCGMERNLNTFDCSFRSKKSVDVNVLARKFGGGGHVNASGCILTGTFRQVREKLIATIKETLKEQGYND